MDTILLVDGNAILHRAYHAYPRLTTSKGELINAVYGFTSILLTVLNQTRPKYVAVAFDEKAPTFRHKEFKAYKAHRPKMDQALVDQIDRVHEVVQALNIPIFEVDGFEGDDIIGTLAKIARQDKKEKSVIITTGDYDTLQLVDDGVKVFIPSRGKKPGLIFDKQAVLQKYGFEPRYVVDFKALAGDASDGITGVTGIGPKSAANLIIKFGTIEKIYDNLDNSKVKEAIVVKLKEGKKNAFLSKKLARIVVNVPLKVDFHKCCLLDYDDGKVIRLFEELEFRSLIKKLPHDGWNEEKEESEELKEKSKESL